MATPEIPSPEKNEEAVLPKNLCESLGAAERNGEEPRLLARRLREFMQPKAGEELEEVHARERAVDRAIDELVKNFKLRNTLHRFLWLSYKKFDGMLLDNSPLETLLERGRSTAKTPKHDGLTEHRGNEAFIDAIEQFRNDVSPVLLKHALLEIAENDPECLLYKYKQYRDIPYSKEIVLQAALCLAEKDPKASAYQFRPGVYIEDIPSEVQREILEMILKKDPRPIAHNLYRYIEDEFKDRNDLRPLLIEAKQVADFDKLIGEEMEFGERVTVIDDRLHNINAELMPRGGHSALDRFNQETGMSLRCMGIRSNEPSFVMKEQYFEFVFINTFSGINSLPFRIALQYGEIRGAKSAADALVLLRSKYQEQLVLHQQQYDVWQKAESFDLPREGKTAVMLAIVPHLLRGIESDFVRMGEIYTKEYGASVVAVGVENENNWKEAREKGGAGTMPEASEATTEKLLSDFGAQLRKAIDDGKRAFVFHFMMHGDDDGTFSTADEKSVSSERIAAVCSQQYKGKPISSQLQIFFIRESCLSGSQTEKDIAFFQNKNISVKEYIALATSAKDTSSTAGLQLGNAGLISEKMRGDDAALFSYYFSYYHELLDHMRTQGVMIKPPVGTLSHAFQFADRMSREESSAIAGPAGQNPEGRRYSTEKKLNDYFTQLLGSEGDTLQHT